MSPRVRLFSIAILCYLGLELVCAIDPKLKGGDIDDYYKNYPRHQKLITCDNLEEYVDACYADYNEEFSNSPKLLGGPSCSTRVPYCFGKRAELEMFKIHPDIDASCVSSFDQGPDCNLTTIYDKCCRLPFQHSGNTCPPINYGTCEFTTCTPFGVQCNSAFRCVAPLGFGCDQDSDCISGLFCTSCVCSSQPPVGPPIEPPVEPPVTPPVTPPIAPPVEPPVTPPVAPPVPIPEVTCLDNPSLVPILEQCQIDCGVACTICGQVWTYCTTNGFISANFTLDACITILFDNTDTGLGFCPFLSSLDGCCDNPIPPVNPPVIAPITPPLGPEVPVINCTDNAAILSVLEACQIACGAGCQFCGDVYSFCEENGFLAANYTLDTCMTVTLDYTLVVDGCAYNASLNQCCGVPPPPPSIECTVESNNNITSLLLLCESECGSDCQFCGEVFSYCEERLYFSSNFTVDTCMTVSLDYQPVSGGCPYNESLAGCCGFPPPPPQVCVNNTAVEETLLGCQVECGTNCPFCGDIFSYCVLNGNISVNYTLDTCLTVTLDYIPAVLGQCPFTSSLTACCADPVPPIPPPPAIVDCVDNPTIVALLDTCQTLCGADCDYCGQVFSYCQDNGFILGNFTLGTCNIIYLDFIPTSAGQACPFNDTLEFCCSEVEPPVPIVNPTSPLPVTAPLVDCTDNPEIVTVLNACQTLCVGECEFCGQVYTFCSDSNLLQGNFTVDACLVINLDFIPTTAGPCPFNDTLTSCCSELAPPLPVVTNKVHRRPFETQKCSLKRYEEAYYCMMAYKELDCDQRLLKCENYILDSVQSDESLHCLVDKVSRSSHETCHLTKALQSCC